MTAAKCPQGAPMSPCSPAEPRGSGCQGAGRCPRLPQLPASPWAAGGDPGLMNAKQNANKSKKITHGGRAASFQQQKCTMGASQRAHLSRLGAARRTGSSSTRAASNPPAADTNPFVRRGRKKTEKLQLSPITWKRSQRKQARKAKRFVFPIQAGPARGC